MSKIFQNLLVIAGILLLAFVSYLVFLLVAPPQPKYQIQITTDPPAQENASASTQIQTAVLERGKAVLIALKNKDMAALSALAHPEKGVRFSPHAQVDVDYDIAFTADQIKVLLADPIEYIWGKHDGSGLPVKMTPAHYLDKFIYKKDFLAAKEVSFNQIIQEGNVASNLNTTYPAAVFVEYHFPGEDPRYDGMDWKSLRLVFEPVASTQETAMAITNWYLIGVINDQWTI